LTVDQDHRGVGAIEPAEHRSSSLQQVFRQTTRSRVGASRWLAAAGMTKEAALLQFMLQKSKIERP